MSESFEAVFVSPHLDDVALSCGGQVAGRVREGQNVLVLTVFADDEPPRPHSALIERIHQLFGLSERVMEMRRAEDSEACARLGAIGRHWRLAEAIYRRDDSGDWSYATLDSLFREPVPSDAVVRDMVSARLAELSPGAELFVPLGVGGHVDHRLVRQAAEEHRDDLQYYEEIPYSQKRGAVRQALGPGYAWSSHVVRVEKGDLERKIEACRAYESQIGSLYRTIRRMERKLRRRAKRLGGERIWGRRRSDPEAS